MAEQIEHISEAIGVVFENQKELAKSESKLDEQFAVLTRLSIMSLNGMFGQWNQFRQWTMQAPPAGLEEVMKPLMLIGYQDINRMFEEWIKFRSRPDFRDHMRPWFMGEDLSTLPAPEIKEGETNAAQDNPGDETASSQPIEPPETKDAEDAVS